MLFTIIINPLIAIAVAKDRTKNALILYNLLLFIVLSKSGR